MEIDLEHSAGRFEHHAAVLAQVQVGSDVSIHTGGKLAVQVFANQANCFFASHTYTLGLGAWTIAG